MADARLEAALAEHFYRAARRWAELDGEPVEALVEDRFLVAAQDAVASLGLLTDDDVPTWLLVPWWSRLGLWLRPYWHGTDTRVWRWQRKPCRYVVVTPSRTDRQPPDSSSEANGGQGLDG